MVMNRAALGVLAVACVVAAGGGAYLAVRQAASAPRDTEIASPASAPAEAAVTETESVITDAPAVPAASSVSTTSMVAASSQNHAAARSNVAARPASRETVTVNKTTVPARTAPVTGPSSPSPAPSAANDSATAAGADRAWPTGAASDSTAPISAGPAAEPEPSVPVAAEIAPAEPELPQKTFKDLVVASDSVLGLQIDTAVTSETAHVEDRVQARVTRDVKVNDLVAIPAGTRAEGSIILVDRGGKFKERARLGIRFHTLVLADGTRVTLNTDPVYRDGASPAGESSAKVGGAAVGGAVLGAILGGRKGAVIGGTVGAAGGTAAVMTGDRNAATVPPGATLTVRLTAPVTVTVEE